MTQTFFYVIKRSSQNLSVRAYLSVLNGKQSFCILCCHSQKRRKFHPEKRSRSACNSGSHTYYVTRSYRGGKRGTQRTEAGNISFAVFFVLNHILKSLSEMPNLYKFCSDRHKKADCQYQDNKRYTPYPVVNYCQNFVKLFHFFPPLKFLKIKKLPTRNDNFKE